MREDLNSEDDFQAFPPGMPNPFGPSGSLGPSEEEDSGDELLEEEEHQASLEDWKTILRQDFEAWLHSIDKIPEAQDEFQDHEAPDLYAFYEQFAAATAETRKANRRTAEAFSQWGQTLAHFEGDFRLLREQMARIPTQKENSLPRAWCLSLAEVLDRVQRIAAAFKTTPRKSWWTANDSWQKAWQTQRQGFEILASHLEELLKKAGMTRIGTLNQPFDPTSMTAVAAEENPSLPSQTVIEELAAGYLLNGELLRVAQVKVSTNKPRQTP